MSGLEKNVAGQKWVVFAFDRTDNTPKTGDAGNITANLRIDGGAANAVDNTNPTELEDGFYVFDLTQAETNGDMILNSPASSTGDIQVIGVPGVIFTVAPNFRAMGIESDGDLTKVNALNGHTAQTGDSFARIGANGGSLTALATPTNITAGTITTVTNLTNAPTNGDLTATMKSSVTTAATAATPTVADVTADVTTDAASRTASKADVSGLATSAALSTHDGKLDTVGGVVDAILVDTGTTLPATLAALNDISASDVNAQVLDVLNVDTFAEPGQGAPGATVSIVDKLGFLYKAWRNKSDQNSSTYQLYNDDASTVDHKATVSDDGTTFTRGEVATGP